MKYLMALIKLLLFRLYWSGRIDRFIEDTKKRNPNIKEWDVWYGWDGLNPLITINGITFKLVYRKKK